MDKQENKSERSFGDFLRTIRQIKGLRLCDISEKSGISMSYLSRLENSKRASPSQNILKKLASTLEVSFISLLQISLDVDSEDSENLKNIILEGKYTINGTEVSKEARILLWNVIEYILDGKHSIGEISRNYTDNLLSRIKLLNKLL